MTIEEAAHVRSGTGRRIVAVTGYALLAVGSIWGGGIMTIREEGDRMALAVGILCFCFAEGCAVAAMRRLRRLPASLASGFPMAAIGGTLLVALAAGEVANVRAGHPLGDWHDAWKPMTLLREVLGHRSAGPAGPGEDAGIARGERRSCPAAAAMLSSTTVPIDPRGFKISKGRLASRSA
jgi:hypothetical protein